ncbi:MAG: chromosomal replication initiator protein DnaA [Victivallaceae bacterium]|nr:chromosomal replication initiator protein DnaA [Victivallaceae bacterium]
MLTQTVCPAGALWEQVLARVAAKDNSASLFLAALVPLGVKEQVLTIGVGDQLYAQWLTRTYGKILDEALHSVAGEQYSYCWQYGCTPNREVQEPEQSRTQTVSEPEEATAEPAQAEPKKFSGEQNFGNFVVCEENRCAYAAAEIAATDPGRYNPLYIYGGTGVGKTHLLHAVANRVLDLQPDAEIRYATCESVLNEFVEVLQNKRDRSAFRNSLRNVELLLVDDVHILGRSQQLQEEFFNLFNTLYGRGKQIILTSDKQPSEIKGLEARLVTRFESGVTTELCPPDYEARLAILKIMYANCEHPIHLSNEVLEFIASNISSSVRVLRGAFNRVMAHVEIMRIRDISVSEVEALLEARLMTERAAKTVSIEMIQQNVAEQFNLKLSDILGSKRPKNIAEPRMVAMYLCRKHTTFSLPEIGAAFGRNHATVINALKRVPEMCAGSEEMRGAIAQLEHRLCGARVSKA